MGKARWGMVAGQKFSGSIKVGESSGVCVIYFAGKVFHGGRRSKQGKSLPKMNCNGGNERVTHLFPTSLWH